MNDTEEPVIVIQVRGGVADYEIVRGDADVYLWDWDNFNGGDGDAWMKEDAKDYPAEVLEALGLALESTP